MKLFNCLIISIILLFVFNGKLYLKGLNRASCTNRPTFNRILIWLKSSSNVNGHHFPNLRLRLLLYLQKYYWVHLNRSKYVIYLIQNASAVGDTVTFRPVSGHLWARAFLSQIPCHRGSWMMIGQTSEQEEQVAYHLQWWLCRPGAYSQWGTAGSDLRQREMSTLRWKNPHLFLRSDKLALNDHNKVTQIHGTM